MQYDDLREKRGDKNLVWLWKPGHHAWELGHWDDEFSELGEKYFAYTKTSDVFIHRALYHGTKTTSPPLQLRISHSVTSFTSRCPPLSHEKYHTDCSNSCLSHASIVIKGQGGSDSVEIRADGLKSPRSPTVFPPPAHWSYQKMILRIPCGVVRCVMAIRSVTVPGSSTETKASSSTEQGDGVVARVWVRTGSSSARILAIQKSLASPLLRGFHRGLCVPWAACVLPSFAIE